VAQHNAFDRPCWAESTTWRTVPFPRQPQRACRPGRMRFLVLRVRLPIDAARFPEEGGPSLRHLTISPEPPGARALLGCLAGSAGPLIG